MQDSEEHQHGIKKDDCKTSSKEVIQDPIQHVGEPGRSQIDAEQLEVRSIENLHHIILNKTMFN